MKKLFYGFVLTLLCSTPLFSEKDVEEKPTSKLMKIPLSFLPGAKGDVDDNEEEYCYEVSKKEKEKKRHKKRQKSKRKQGPSKKKNKATPYKYLINSWEPYWISVKELEPSKQLFFQANIGVGFLYFSKVRGNLGGTPGNMFRNAGSVPLQGRLTYNKTPLFEYVLGYRLTSFLKVGLSFQNQSGVSIQTNAINSEPGTRAPGLRLSQSLLRSDFGISALMLKGYVEFPWPMVWKMMAYSPYVGVGFGAGWQSWTNNEWTNQTLGNGYASTQMFLTSKFSGNCVWGADAGFKIQSAKPGKFFSIFAGVKYNQWGQAREIGQIQNQGASKFGIFKPFKIRTIYSFAPYLALQWNIANSSFGSPVIKINDRYVDTWKPFLVSANQLQTPESVFTQFNGGIGFLYFAGIKGDITFTPPNDRQNQGLFSGKYSMKYNRTPVIEYLFGYRISPSLTIGISKQSQSRLFINTKMKRSATGPVAVGGAFNGTINTTARLQANLNLLSTAAKIYVETPKALIWKNLAYTLFVSSGVGPSWQTWTRMGVAFMSEENGAGLVNDQEASCFMPLRPKVIANIFLMADAGLRIKNANPNVNFYMIAGCRYNYWGSARNLGKITQQYPSFREGLFKPLNIKTVYSFVPYLGVQWNFEDMYKHRFRKTYIIKKRPVNVWFPYFARLVNLEKKRPFFTQVNTGVGFLYFDKIRGNFAGQPQANGMVISGEGNFNGAFSYNRTPLFEYLVGCRIFDFLNVAISYQYQTEVAVSTPVIPPNNARAIGSGFNARGNRFVANFRTDAILAKFFFNSPFSIIWLSMINTPYLAPGIGVGWQSWTRIDLQRIGARAQLLVYSQYDQPINQKISGNLVWTIDVGIRSTSAYPNSKFASTIGVKYIDWGQARWMGLAGNQNGSSINLFKPFKIRMVYSFAPYFGVQWNF